MIIFLPLELELLFLVLLDATARDVTLAEWAVHAVILLMLLLYWERWLVAT
jgi:hypothetical protein